MYQRAYLQLLINRIKEDRQFIQVIYGPRQVGKTTVVHQLLETLQTPCQFNAADAIGANGGTWLEEEWQAARLKLKQSGATEYLLIIDEIQKIPGWSELVKKFWDEDARTKTNLKVILLGSSRILLQQGLTESLAGRFETIYMGHWSYQEMHTAFGWTAEEYAWYGGYPGSAPLIGEEERWKNYVTSSLIESSISRDILLLTRVDKPALMRRLFEFGCLYSDQILSYNKMLGQLLDAGNTTTLSHYLNLLDTAGLVAGLEKFAGDHIRKRGSSPKFQVHNTALIAAQKAELMAQVQQQPAEWGRIVESSIGAHLLNSALQYGFELSYWRDGNDEIDFVITYKHKVAGLEIKSGHTMKASGMAAFKKKYNPDKIYKIGESISWQEMLQIDPRELF